MKLSKYLAEKFEKEFDAIFEKEKIDKEFLSQEQFGSCLERASAGIDLATEGIKHDLAYMIALHREKEHGENTMDEQAALLKAGADPSIGVMSFWSE